MNTWHAYVAGFFDGEGWVVIGIERNEGRSDVHHMGVYITQRVRFRNVLDRIQAEFGGKVSVRTQKSHRSERWAEQANWHVHAKHDAERFLLAMQPYCLVKARQVEIGLQFLRAKSDAPPVRDTLGRVHGRALSPEVVAERERLRLELKEANALGPSVPGPARRHPPDPPYVHPAKVPVVHAGMIPRGERRWNAQLTEEAVRAIRAEYPVGGITQTALARRYGVSATAINKVLNGTAWSHVV